MKNLLEQFSHYLAIERGFSPRTIEAYKQDLQKFIEFLDFGVYSRILV